MCTACKQFAFPFFRFHFSLLGNAPSKLMISINYTWARKTDSANAIYSVCTYKYTKSQKVTLVVFIGILMVCYFWVLFMAYFVFLMEIKLSIQFHFWHCHHFNQSHKEINEIFESKCDIRFKIYSFNQPHYLNIQIYLASYSSTHRQTWTSVQAMVSTPSNCVLHSLGWR